MNYLYNGVGPLPALPEWDRETYPYCWMMKHGNTEFGLYIADNKLTGTWSSIYEEFSPNYFGRYGMYKVPVSGTEWTFSGYNYDDDEWSKLIIGVVFWTNHDIFNEDGTLYLAASEPAPVPQWNPSAMLMGFQVGQAVRRMRK